MDINPVTRSLNAVYMVHGSHDAFVNYSIDIACTLSLSGGQTGTVFLEYADDEAWTTNITEACRTVNGNTGTLTIGLNIAQNCTAQVSGMIAAGKWVKIRTANTTGSPTFSWRSGQEAVI